MVVVNGTSGYNQGSITFSISPPPPVPDIPSTIPTDCPYNLTAGLYLAPLDPSVWYNFTMSIGGSGNAVIAAVIAVSSLS